MSATLLATTTAPPLWPKAKRWTCAEYYDLAATGLFAGRRTFLIDGEIYEMAPGDPMHSTSTVLGLQALTRAFGAGHHVRVQLPLPLGLSTDPEPDLAVVAGQPRDYATRHPDTAVLVVEVSDSSRTFDLREKASLYAAGGIAEYWVIDVIGRQLIVHRDPQGDAGQRFGHGYATVLNHDASETVQSLAGNHPVRVADLLP